MIELKITPAIIKEYAIKQKPAIITFSKTRIIFSESLIKKLNLKVGDHFTLNIKYDKIFYKDEHNGIKDAFILYKSGKNMFSASASGILQLLFKHKIIKEVKTTKFILDKFDRGEYQLKPYKTKKDEKNSIQTRQTGK